MKFLERGFCPFRIEKSNFQAGCVLQLGKESLCYTQDARPLVSKGNQFFCPKLIFNLSKEIYNEIEKLITPILAIQDEENTGINIWPLVTGVANPKYQAITNKGKKMQKISLHLKDELQEIVLELT